MKARNFSLVPFPGTGPWPVMLTGTFLRRSNTLSLTYHLSGRITDVEVPPKTDQPARRIGLWENTCFEFFVGPKDSNRYWEFNLSPSGDWNVFFFETYRGRLVEETAFTSLPFLMRRQSDSLELVLELDLGIIIPADHPLKMAVSAVVKTGAGGLSWWALTHLGPEPDFHHKDSFMLEL